MTTGTVPGILAGGAHASRPGAGAVSVGSLWACTDHPLIYQSDGSTWATWAVLGSAIADVLDLPTAEMNAALVMAPDGAGGLQFRAEAGGGGGMAHAYLGTNSVGGSVESMTDSRMLMKRITLPSDGLLVSIGAALQMQTNGAVDGLYGGLWSDSAGSPTSLIAITAPPVQTLYINTTNRWLEMALVKYLTAGDYWIGIASGLGGSRLNIAYAAGGSDRYYTAGGDYTSDSVNMGGTTTGTRDYSIRAGVLA